LGRAGGVAWGARGLNRIGLAGLGAAGVGTAGVGATGVGLLPDQPAVAAEPARAGAAGGALRPVRFGVSTYSFWQFREQRVEIESCLEQAARMGFDGVEILQVQMREESNGYLQSLKRQAV